MLASSVNICRVYIVYFPQFRIFKNDKFTFALSQPILFQLKSLKLCQSRNYKRDRRGTLPPSLPRPSRTTMESISEKENGRKAPEIVYIRLLWLRLYFMYLLAECGNIPRVYDCVYRIHTYTHTHTYSLLNTSYFIYIYLYVNVTYKTRRLFS